MDKYKEIRPIALGVIIKDGKLLVENCYNEVKDEKFYRCLGGGIEFLEKSEDTLKREFKEEIGAEVEVGNFLGLCENIFNYQGKDAHELVLFYDAKLKSDDIKDEYHKLDDDHNKITWENIEDFKDNKKIVYPKEVLEYI